MSHDEHNHQQPKKKKKFYSRFTKYLIERDTLFATIWVFVFIVGLGSIPLNLYVLNPLKMGLKDFDYTDLAYAELGKGNKPKLDNNIVIVNTGEASREEMAYIIQKTSSYQPKAIGLDIWMEEAKDPTQDSILAEIIKQTPNLILASRFSASENKQGYVFRDNYFKEKTDANQGYVNFFEEELATIRKWHPFYYSNTKDRNSKQKSFVAAIIERYDSSAFNTLKKRGNKYELINYTRRLSLTDSGSYRLVQPERLMLDQVDSSYLKDKIILIGYMSPNPYDVEDKKFTPMNKKFAGKSIPDMDGLVVHANAISMVLEKNYIKKIPNWINLLIAFAVCWLFMSFFIHYYLESHIWFHLVAKIAQVASIFLFAYLGILLYDRYSLKLDMKLTLIVIVMAVDVIYFYEAFAVWMHKKFNYQTVFKPHHH